MKVVSTVSRLGVVALLAVGLTACSEDATSSSGGGSITYWATSQAGDPARDEEILQPELDKFEEQTGIQVDLEVYTFNDINTKLLAATASGRGPDVTNFGNTNAFTYGSSGALLEFGPDELEAIGGTDRFIPAVLAASGQSPITSVPLYSQAYGLFYNKALLEEAGVEPPETWEDLLAAAETLTDPDAGRYGLSFEGASEGKAMHFNFIFGKQHGASPFTADNEPDFASPGMVAGTAQYLDLWAKGLVNPSNAEYNSTPQQLGDFVDGRAAMIMATTSAIGSLSSLGMDLSEYGVVPIPSPEPLPSGGQDIASFVAGTNIAIFENASDVDAALEFVNFMTSAEEQGILNSAYQLIPVLTDSPQTFLADEDMAATFSDILLDRAEPLPPEAPNTLYQAAVASAVIGLVREIAQGGEVTEQQIEEALQSAQDQMPEQ